MKADDPDIERVEQELERSKRAAAYEQRRMEISVARQSTIDGDVIKWLIKGMGDDPAREGLVETPDRVVRSWRELFAGYCIDPFQLVKTFEEGACEEMVVARDIEMYSTCEHHLLPFFGRAHIAYIPNGRIVGISKLARILEVYSRRLQIQERIGMGGALEGWKKRFNAVKYCCSVSLLLRSPSCRSLRHRLHVLAESEGWQCRSGGYGMDKQGAEQHAETTAADAAACRGSQGLRE